MSLTIEDIDSDPTNHFLIEEIYENGYIELRTKEEVFEIITAPDTINKYFRWHSITNNHDIYSIIFTCHELNYDFIFELCQKYDITFNPLSRYLIFTNQDIDIEIDDYFEILKIQTIHIKEIKDADLKINTPPLSPKYKKENDIIYINLDNRFHNIAANFR